MIRLSGILTALACASLCNVAFAQLVAPSSVGARWVAVGNSGGDQLSISTVLGDIDGDGLPELAAFEPVQFGPANTYVLSGADGSLLSAQFSSIGDAGDVNADGFADMWTYDWPADLIRILAGPSLTTTLHSYPIASNTNSIFGVGDMNADGCDDHAIRNSVQNSVTVHSGSDGAVLHLLTSVSLPQVNAAGDLNDDGYADLIVGNVPFSGRDGSIPAGVNSPVPGGPPIGDVDADGIRDFLVTGRVFSGATGAILLDFWTTPYLPYAGAGDIDGDGHEDLWTYESGVTQQWVEDPCVTSPIVNVTVTAATVLSGLTGLPILSVYPNTVIGVLPGANYVRTTQMTVGTVADSRSGAPSVYFYDANTDISLCGPFGPTGSDVGMAGIIDITVPGTPPVWTERGSSCAGSDGAHPHASLQGRPALAETIRWRLWGVLSGATCALQLGTPATVDLSSLLGPGCELLVSPFFAEPATADADGFAISNPLTIPLDPALVGDAISAQWFAVDLAANPFGVSASDALDLTVGS